MCQGVQHVTWCSGTYTNHMVHAVGNPLSLLITGLIPLHLSTHGNRRRTLKSQFKRLETRGKLWFGYT